MSEQEQILGAVMAVRTSPTRRWSLNDFAHVHLSGTAHQKFLAAIPNAEASASMFDFQRSVFDDALQFRVYALDTGVWVSSPLSEIGRSVQVQGDTERRLSCEGLVVEEKVRSRHA